MRDGCDYSGQAVVWALWELLQQGCGANWSAVGVTQLWSWLGGGLL